MIVVLTRWFVPNNTFTEFMLVSETAFHHQPHGPINRRVSNGRRLHQRPLMQLRQRQMSIDTEKNLSDNPTLFGVLQAKLNQTISKHGEKWFELQ